MRRSAVRGVGGASSTARVYCEPVLAFFRCWSFRTQSMTRGSPETKRSPWSRARSLIVPRFLKNASRVGLSLYCS